MARPPLTDDSFYAHVFSPKKNPLPTGLRKVKLKGNKTHKTRRVNMFNKLSPVNQEVLKRAGMRDDYLRGDATLGDAKRHIRPNAVRRGLARSGRITQTGDERKRALARFKKRVRDEHIASGRKVNSNTIEKEVSYADAVEEMDMLGIAAEAEHWDSGRLRYAARKGSQYEWEDTTTGRLHNPFWYH